MNERIWDEGTSEAYDSILILVAKGLALGAGDPNGDGLADAPKGEAVTLVAKGLALATGAVAPNGEALAPKGDAVTFVAKGFELIIRMKELTT